MANRGSPVNLIMSLVGWLVFMMMVLAVVGSGVGTVELLIWLGLVGLGLALLVGRYVAASRPPR